MTEPHCANCHGTDHNPAPRSPDMGIRPVVMCDRCVIALYYGMGMFEELGRDGEKRRKKAKHG